MAVKAAFDTHVWFVKFEPCKFCGSRDNAARYSDGHLWCFGCKKYTPSDLTKSAILTENTLSVKPKYSLTLPDDISPLIGAKGWTWLQKYGILHHERSRFRWSDKNEWLIYLIDNDGHWWVRQFAHNATRKNLNSGKLSDILHIIPNNSENDEIILVEDILSAIKVGRHTNAMPLWGSHIPLKLIVRLSGLFKRVGIWLDRDKAGDSLVANRRASQLGLTARSIISERDPKEYNDEAIIMFLNGSLGWNEKDL